jgi:excisionase family DNA binding protein
MPKPKNLTTQQHAAQVVNVTDRTVRGWISKGLITGYRTPSGRAIRVDLSEILEKMQTIPSVIGPKPQPFGPLATIVELSEDQETDEGDE